MDSEPMRQGVLAILVLLANAGFAHAASSFSYDFDVKAGTYRSDLDLKFSPDVNLSRLVQNIKSETLLSELNPAMERGEIIEKEAGRSDSILAFKVLGLRFEMLSHCQEAFSDNGSLWDRQCVLDPAERNARYFMSSKSEQIHCEQKAGDGPQCHVSIHGSLKKLPLLSLAKLTVKAKVETLVNWGKFWIYTQGGSVSTRLANERYEQSPLKSDIERMQSEGLGAAESAGDDLQLKKAGDFRLPDHGSLGASKTLQSEEEMDLASGAEVTRNSELKLYQNGEALKPILQTVQNARRFIFVQELSLVCDSSTEPLISALEAKARSGADVRLLIHRMYAKLDSGCLRRLENAGVGILTGPFHASYFVNDQSELVIGSESVARMFFQSNGEDDLDRDMMLYARGPIATDALGDFLSAWDGTRSSSDRDIASFADFYQERRRGELSRGDRGMHPGAKEGVCRFAAQKPGGREHTMERLLDSWIGSARKNVFFSGVKLDTKSPWAAHARDRAEHGVQVDFLCNGRQGGNGELTMLLNEWVSGLEQKPIGGFGLARLVGWLRDWDRDRVFEKNERDQRGLIGPRDLRIWSYPGFAHYKVWSVDQRGFWIGSANPDREALHDDYEAGVLCEDEALTQEFRVQAEKDRSRGRQIFNAL